MGTGAGDLSRWTDAAGSGPIVALSALEHHVYCPRQCALIHVDGSWADNEHTVRGEAGHRRVDSGKHRTERGRLVLRSIPLWSELLGLTGRADAVEVYDCNLVPVEYKIGVPHGDAADVQLCAQALCLEEMTGIPVAEGAIWFAATRRRQRVEFDERLRTRTLTVIEEVRAELCSALLPEPAGDNRCQACQLLGVCQPEVSGRTLRVERYMEEEVRRCGS